MNNCTCCGNSFPSEGDLKRHRKMKLQHAMHKYKQYVKDMNQKNNICNCLCCAACFPPSNKHMPVVNWNNCQLRVIISNELDQLWSNTDRCMGCD